MWRAQASRLVVGNAAEEATEVGPLIRPREVQRVDEWVAEAAQAGGTVLCGGEPAGKTAYRATILLNPPAEVRLSTQEILGPVIAVDAYDALDDAVSMANALPIAFQDVAGLTRTSCSHALR